MRKQLFYKLVKKGSSHLIIFFARRHPTFMNWISKSINTQLNINGNTNTLRARSKRSTGTREATSSGTRSHFNFAIIQVLSQLPANARQLDIVTALCEAGMLGEREAHVWLHSLFSARRIDEFAQIIDCDKIPFADIKLYHKIRLASYRGLFYFDDAAMLSYFFRMHDHPVVGRGVAFVATEHFVRSKNATSLIAIFKSLGSLASERLPNSLIDGAMRVLCRSGCHEFARDVLYKHLQHAAGETKLFFLEAAQTVFEPAQLTSLGYSNHVNWRDVLETLRSSYTAVDNEDQAKFTRLIYLPLTRIPAGDSDYMDVRYSPKQRENLLNVITQRLQSKAPLSLVRLGDGEAYAFPAPVMRFAPSDVLEHDNMVRELHWWGEIVPPERSAVIKERVRRAAGSADILGIPSVYRFIRDRGAPWTPFGASRLHRGLGIVLNAISEYDLSDDRIYTEERCHQVIFHTKVLERLAERAEKTVVVGCWSKEQLNIDLGEKTVVIQISPHTQVKHAFNGAYSRPLFETYEMTLEAIERHAGPGVLVLVGGGIIGKIFVDHARKKGAVALDIGSVLDYAAGFTTRSTADVA